jgi:hypothetical protein
VGQALVLAVIVPKRFPEGPYGLWISLRGLEGHMKALKRAISLNDVLESPEHLIDIITAHKTPAYSRDISKQSL